MFQSDVTGIRRCQSMSVNSMDTTHEEHADTTDTESVGSDSDIVTSCRSRRCAYTEDSDGSGDEGQCSLYWCWMCQYHICCKCVESVWRVVGITATNGYWRGTLWRSMRGQSQKQFNNFFLAWSLFGMTLSNLAHFPLGGNFLKII